MGMGENRGTLGAAQRPALWVPDLMGTSWGWRFLACSPIGILGQGVRGPQGWHRDGTRNSAPLPPQLGPPTPTSSSKADGHAGLYWLHWVSFPLPSGLQEAVSWAAPWQSVSLNLPPARHLLLPPHPSPAEVTAGTQGWARHCDTASPWQGRMRPPPCR